MENTHATEGAKKSFSSKHYFALIILILAVALSWSFMRPGSNSDAKDKINNFPKTEKQFVVMGTFARIVIFAEPELAAQACKTVKDVFKRIETACNIFNPDSEVSKLNSTAYDKPFKCSPLLWNMFNSSRLAYDVSEGQFDVTARPLMLLWGFYRKRGETIPRHKEILDAKAKVGLDKVIFDEKNHTVKFKIKGMSVDFGGLAKGIAVQVAVRRIKALGVKHGVIDLGGNMYCLGYPPAPRKAYSIGIRNPLKPKEICAKVKLSNEAVATSGNYERYVTIKGHHYTHIMNPKTGKPVENMLSVTVVNPDAGYADMLSTAVFINGVEYAKRVFNHAPRTGIYIIKRRDDDKSKIEMIRLGRIDLSE